MPLCHSRLCTDCLAQCSLASSSPWALASLASQDALSHLPPCPGAIKLHTLSCLCPEHPASPPPPQACPPQSPPEGPLLQQQGPLSPLTCSHHSSMETVTIAICLPLDVPLPAPSPADREQSMQGAQPLPALTSLPTPPRETPPPGSLSVFPLDSSS